MMKEKRTISRAIKELRENYYLKNAKKIKEICDRATVDVGVGADILENKTGKYYPDQKQAFLKVLREFPLNDVVEELEKGEK